MLEFVPSQISKRNECYSKKPSPVSGIASSEHQMCPVFLVPELFLKWALQFWHCLHCGSFKMPSGWPRSNQYWAPQQDPSHDKVCSFIISGTPPWTQPEQNQKGKENIPVLGMRKGLVWRRWTYPTPLTDSALTICSLLDPTIQFRQLDLTCWNPDRNTVSVTNYEVVTLLKVFWNLTDMLSGTIKSSLTSTLTKGSCSETCDVNGWVGDWSSETLMNAGWSILHSELPPQR